MMGGNFVLCKFSVRRYITFQLGKFTNFEALFPVGSTDFPQLVHVKS